MIFLRAIFYGLGIFILSCLVDIAIDGIENVNVRGHLKYTMGWICGYLTYYYFE